MNDWDRESRPRENKRSLMEDERDPKRQRQVEREETILARSSRPFQSQSKDPSVVGLDEASWADKGRFDGNGEKGEGVRG